MNARHAGAAVAVVLALAPRGAPAQEARDTSGAATVVQVRLVNEASSDRSNPETLMPGAGRSQAWQTSDYGMAALDASWSANARLRLGGAAAVFGDTASGNVRLRVRQAYARVSATDWLDVEGGKRILKWGTGYAFTPTGVLDPPRDPADPRDRLGVNEGVVYGGIHLFRGDTALSVVGALPDTWRSSVPTAPHHVVAARLRTLVHGFEVAAIAGTADTTGPSWGANFTHVIGDNLEWHGEVLVHRRGPVPGLPPALLPPESRDREVSVLVGCQYTFNVGVNVVLEYYHDGNGLGRDAWTRLTSLARLTPQSGLPTSDSGLSTVSSGLPTPDAGFALPGLRQFAFVRFAPAAAEPKLLPEVLAIAGLEDGSLTLVPGLTWTAQLHLQVYVRGTLLTGRSGSVARAAASRGGLQAGVAVRF